MMFDFLGSFLTYPPTPDQFKPNVTFQFYHTMFDFANSTYLSKNRDSFMDDVKG